MVQGRNTLGYLRMLDTSALGQIGTRKLRHLCETFRHQYSSAPVRDISAPGQFDTCVFSLILRTKLPIALNQFPNLNVILMFCNGFFSLFYLLISVFRIIYPFFTPTLRKIPRLKLHCCLWNLRQV
jgi:hypothetical protein